jgi:hypothetical protein
MEIFFQKRRGALIYRPLVHLIASVSDSSWTIC